MDAVDLDDEKVISVLVSFGRSDLESFKRYTIISFGPKSAIERLFGDIEQRIRQFWNGFIGKYTKDSMERWVEAFAEFRNWKKDSKGALS